MKKKWLILQLLALFVAVMIFCTYWIISRSRLDLTAPVITIDDALLEVSVQDPRSVLMQGVSARDNRDGDVTAGILIESVYGITDENMVTVTYAAFDKSGNVSKAERVVHFYDYREPKFVLNMPLAFSNGEGGNTMNFIGAYDVIDGDIRRNVRATLVSDSGTLYDVGLHQVKFRVTNSLGDSVDVVFPVEVYEKDRFNARLQLKEYLVYLPKGSAFDVNYYLSTFTYAGQDMVLGTRLPDEMTLKIDNQVNTMQPGVYAVSYTVSYEYGRNTYTAFSKLIVIIEE